MAWGFQAFPRGSACCSIHSPRWVFLLCVLFCCLPIGVAAHSWPDAWPLYPYLQSSTNSSIHCFISIKLYSNIANFSCEKCQRVDVVPRNRWVSDPSWFFTNLPNPHYQWKRVHGGDFGVLEWRGDETNAEATGVIFQSWKSHRRSEGAGRQVFDAD